MSKEPLTYITYNEGLEAKHLHLGNLTHDFRNPTSLEPYIEKAYTDIAEVAPDWCQSGTIENYALTLGKTTAKDGGSGDDSESDEGTNERYQVVAAAKATKLEIKDPEEFFEDITLKSPAANKWLSARLSAAENLNSKQRPQIWMLTGLILMTHATWTSLSAEGHTFTPGLKAPFNPSAVSAVRKLSISEDVKPAFGFKGNDEAKRISGTTIHETGKYPGLRGWAAQWQKIDVKVLPKDKTKEGNQIELKGSANPPKVAVVELLEDVYAKKEDKSSSELDEEYWDAFLDKAEEYV